MSTLFKSVLGAFVAVFATISAFAATVVTTEADLKTALAAGGEVALGADIQLSEALNATADISLDLSGYTLTAGSDGMAINSENGKSVTIKDSGKNGEIKGIINNGNPSTMIIEGGIYTSLDKYVFWNTGTMTINGGVVNGKGSYPLYSYTAGHKMIINNVIVNGECGCLNAYGKGEVIVNGGTFNYAGREGNTYHIVYVSQDTKMTINGGSFQKVGEVDLSAEGGGGICGAGTSELIINGGSFSGAYTDVTDYSASNVITINGGTFKNLFGGVDAVKDDCLAVGAIITNRGTTYTKTEGGLSEISGVARIGAQGYATLEEAIAAAQEGETITLISDINYVNVASQQDKTTSIYIPAGKKFTLDLNGYTISGENNVNGSFAFVTICRGADIIIDDTSANKSGKITYKSTREKSDYNQKGYTIGAMGTLVLNGGTIENTTPLGSDGFEKCVTTAIDIAASNGEMASFIMNGGVVISETYFAIRANVYEGNKVNSENVVVLNAGTVHGLHFCDWGSKDLNYKVAIGKDAVIECGNYVDYPDQSIRLIIAGAAASEVSIDIAEEAQIKGSVYSPIAKVGKMYSYNLTKAIAAAQEGDTITLLKDISVSDSILIDKSLVLDLNSKIITSSHNRSIKINTNGNAAKTVIIKNGTVISTPDAGRCIQLMGDALERLELNGVTFKAEKGQSSQTITLAETNSTKPLEFVVKNSTVVASNNNGYACIFFCPIDATIENSTISGYAALYFKNAGVANTSEGSVVDVIDSNLIGTNVQGGKNTFGTITTEANNVTINVSGGSITANKTNDALQTIVYCGWYAGKSTGLVASLNTELLLGDGCRILDVNEDISAQTVAVRAEYADEMAAEGFSVGSANDNGLVSIVAPVAKIGDTPYATLAEALAAVTDDAQTVTILKDVTENLTGAYLRGNITTENDAKVTINLTNSDWLYCPYTFVLGANVTLKCPSLFYYAGGAQINGKLIVGAYYQRYAGTKLTINEPGSMTVTTEQFYLRYTDGDANAGIYINGDNDDSTIGLNTSVIYFYQGMINAKNANIKTSVYWQTNETDSQGFANLMLDNSKLNITNYENVSKATGNSTVTLKNGSQIITVLGFEGNALLSIDITGMSEGEIDVIQGNLSNFTGKLETVGNDDLEASIVDGKIVLSAKPVAKIEETKYTSLADALAAAQAGDTITLLGDCELVSGIDIEKNITVDGAGYKVYAADIADDTEMFNIRSKVTITNLTFDADHKFSYGIQVQDAADVTLSDVSILYAGNDNWGASVNLNGGKLFVSGDFTAFSGGENGGAFPFTGILYWGGDFKFADGVTASIADPTGATTDSDLLLVGTVGLLSIEDADEFLSQFNIPSGFAPYTLALDADIVSSFGGFTGASPLPWNTIIDYGKQILDAIGESTTETQVTVGLLDDTVIPDVFVYEDANFSINGNGKTLTGTIDVTDNVGTISNVVLTSGTTFVMTNVTTGCVKFGDNVTVSGQVTIVPPANYGVGSAPLIEFTDGSGVKPEDFVIDQSAVEIPEGTEFVVDGNKIVLGTPVAKIGEVKYASLLGAIAAAKSGDTVTLLGDCGITTGIILDKNITIDGCNFTLTAVSGDPSLAQMVKIESAATIKNITLAVNHKYDYGIQMNNPASNLTLENVTILYAGKAEGHKNDELLFGASVFLQQGNLLVKGKFTAFSGGETAGTFPFTGILYWPAGDTAPTFSFADGATASITDPTGATSDSDLLLVGAPGILSVAEADLMLSAFNIPAGFAPYTLKLDCRIVQGVGGGFTGASPLAWNTIIDYGKKILTVVNESTTETQVEVGILDDVEIPEVFVYEDANFSINGNGKVLSGTIDFTDNVGTISNVVLTSDMTFVMTNVTEGCVKLGEGVNITESVKVIPPDNFGRGKDSATLIEFAEGSGLSLENFEIDTSTVQLPEGSQIVQDGNKIIVKLPIAQVGNRKFATLAEAFEAANDGDTVRVLYSFNTNETIVINKAVTFDFSGDVITNTALGAAIQVEAVGVKLIGGELVAKGDGIEVAEGCSAVIERGVYEVRGDALDGAVTVSGGTFNKPANVINAFKSDDCEAVDNGDGWCTVMDYVAQFGEEKYVSLQDAIDAAAATNPTVENPATVTLLGNVSGSVTLPENVIISANGYTVQSVVDSNGYIVELHGGAYQVGKYPEPPPVRSIKIEGNTVKLSFVPRQTLKTVVVEASSDLKTWTAMDDVTYVNDGPGKECVISVAKPQGNNAFFRVKFEYAD